MRHFDIALERTDGGWTATGQTVGDDGKPGDILALGDGGTAAEALGALGQYLDELRCEDCGCGSDCLAHEGEIGDDPHEDPYICDPHPFRI